MTVRPAIPADAVKIAALESASIAHSAWGAAQLSAALSDARYLFFVAETDDKRLVGYAFGDIADGLSVDGVAVAASCRGRGIGRTLLLKLLLAAKERGAAAAFLEVEAQNIAAVTLYRSVGFTVLRVRKGYYGEGLDALDMKKTL